MAFLQSLIETAGFTEVFPPDFPHAMPQALVLPLAMPGTLLADITRHAYTLAAAGVELMRIAHLMNSRHARLLKLMDGEQVVILIAEVKPEEFNFDGNLHDNA